MAYAVDALAFCRSMLGHPYVAGGCRCEVTCYTQDCSGLLVAATRYAGLWMPCISSAGFAVWGRQAGTLISEAEAIWTPFALGIKGPNGGEAGDGPKGHIFPMVGDGKHTYEAMGKRYGICIGSATGRGAVRWMRVPGLRYGPKPLPIPPEEPMFICSPHRPIPDSSIAGASWSPAKSNQVLLVNGASISGDRPVNAATWKPGDDRIWEPPIGVGRKGIGIAQRVWLRGNKEKQPEGTPTGKSIILTDDRGDTFIGNWS